MVVIYALIQSVEFDSQTAYQVYPERRADQQAFRLGIIPVDRRTGRVVELVEVDKRVSVSGIPASTPKWN